MNGTLILVGKVAGTAALAAGALVTGLSATHSADASSTTTKTVHCGRGFGHADPQLKAALKKARQEPAGKQRREALRTVRKDAAKGQYGDAAEIRALRMRLAQAHYRAVAPDALKAALKDAAQQPAGTQRKAAFQKVLADAASGTYGAKVEKIAKHREAKRDACQAKRQQKKQKSSSGSSSSSSTS